MFNKSIGEDEPETLQNRNGEELIGQLGEERKGERDEILRSQEEQSKQQGGT